MSCNIETYWWKEEQEKYNYLYRNGYPDGTPDKTILKHNFDNSLYICDLGCGLGVLSEKFDKYVGIDVSNYVIEKNNIKYKNNINKKFYHGSLDNLSFIKNEKFDLIVCFDVMEHIPTLKLDNVLSEISKLNSDRYYFYISVVKSKMLDKDNNNLHLSVFPHDFWIDKLQKHFKNVKVKIMKLQYHIDILMEIIK